MNPAPRCRQYSVNFGDVMFNRVTLTATSSSAASTSTEESPNENLESRPDSLASKNAFPIWIMTLSIVMILAFQ